MRIGIMLRPLDERGGIGLYTRYLTEELLRLDRDNHYTLFYRSSANLGRFAGYPNVRERLVRAPGKALWDQVAIPWACWREGVDVVLHTKFTVPFLAPAKAVMVLHGADWFLPDQARFYGRLDVAYVRALMPLYIRRAAVVLSVSRLTTDNINQALHLVPGKVRTVYFGPARHFRRIDDAERLEEVRARYRLPGRFILTLTKPGGTERKNLGGVLEAFRLYHGTTPHRLVIGGRDAERLVAEHDVPADGYGRDVHCAGWIDQEDLPAVYTLADLFLYPSRLEAFPIPLTEAMACGTPIVTSNANGLTEIAGDAALRVDPEDPAAIRDAIRSVLTDSALAAELGRRGLERSQRFSWERSARQTLEILEEVTNTSQPSGAAPHSRPGHPR
jgi:glycosyltransferase involved in cell wall biosynthesis